MATIPETLYTKAGVDAAIAQALSGFTPTAPGGVPTITDNGDGTFTILGDSTNLVDNGDGTYTVVGIAPAVVDNGDGTFTLTGAGALTERTYTKASLDTALAAKANYPSGGSDGQALVKSGASTAWSTIGTGGTVADATTTAKGIVQLAGDLAGTAIAPVLKSILSTSGTVGSASVIPVITYNNKGLITAITSVAAAGGGSAVTLTDNGDGTFTIATATVTERAYKQATVDTALAAKANYPSGGTDGQALVKLGTGTNWATITASGSVPDATTTVKGIVQLAGDLAGTAAAPVLKNIVTGATVGSSTSIPVLTVNAKGLITAVSSVTASGGSAVTLTDNGDGTFSIASSGTTETAYTQAGTNTALTGKANYPTGGTDGQALVKSGTSTAWATVSGGGTVVDATTTVKGIVQLAGDLAGTAAAPVLKNIVTGATVGSGSAIPVITFNAKGLITGVTTAAVSGGGGGGSVPTSNSQSGTTYTAVVGDANNIIENTGTSTLTVTIPTNATASMPIGTVIEFLNYNTGTLVMAAASGVTLRSPNGLRLVTRYASAAARKRGTDEWIISGYTTP